MGRIARAGEERMLEPKVMDLLVLLAAKRGEVATHEEIFTALWPETTVGDDTLARNVSKLRKALDDDPKTPVFVQTISKRGYRLIAPLDAAAAPALRAERPWPLIGATAAIVLMVGGALAWRTLTAPPAEIESSALIARAQDSYFQFTRADNEAAVALYERVLASEPANIAALAGLARALTQRSLRWPNPPGGGPDFTRTDLGQALETGRLDTPEAVATLARARDLAERAVRLAPDDAGALQSLGLVLSAQRQFDAAEAAYQRALRSDPEAWGALVNLGDLRDINGAPGEALPYYERAYALMERIYPSEPQRIRPWHAEIGVLVARRHAEAGRLDQAEAWYRRVLTQSPLEPNAVAGLAALLAQRGARAEARELCESLVERTGPNAQCARVTGAD